jgi:histidyl-tRNA synthetase
MITRVRGTEDIVDLRLYNFMLEKIKQHLAIYNFSNIDTPILEHTELFTRSLGSQTDVVSKEMYVFNTAGGESICLRPEGTAGVIRAYIENGIQQSPWKVFLHGPMFRHERPQKGRWRQFNQVSIEIINSAAITQDVQLLKMLDTLFSEVLKIEHYVLKLNFLGCPEDRQSHRAKLVSFLDSATSKICQTCQTRKEKNPLRVFDCKNEDCKMIYTKAPKVIDHLCKECKGEWQELTSLLSRLAVNYVVDALLVRGLDYYCKTVFEFSSRELGAQNAFCGGGRYSLGKDLGAKDDLPCVGVGIGSSRLQLLVEKSIQKLAIPQDQALHVIIPMTNEQKTLALLLAYQLQSNNLVTEVLFENASLSNMMKKANKLGAKYVLIVGPDEETQGTVSVKNMVKGETLVLKQVDVVGMLRT